CLRLITERHRAFLGCIGVSTHGDRIGARQHGGAGTRATGLVADGDLVVTAALQAGLVTYRDVFVTVFGTILARVGADSYVAAALEDIGAGIVPDVDVGIIRRGQAKRTVTSTIANGHVMIHLPVCFIADGNGTHAGSINGLTRVARIGDLTMSSLGASTNGHSIIRNAGYERAIAAGKAAVRGRGSI